ncbi:MAG: aminotransferase class I/II-fold pyridoxal phosphate-dependent enzyme [Candidatus Latescibacteria bacterium]|nr:aminotransferase class I/II-fold pyridoxal phosphate-dependent enzyme [bacterium]MBD3423581.1 aminotransferase class I/II-fold pyridoxal phosphate-dependent enzyme [Candidatus Latescibacterota bacterium]
MRSKKIGKLPPYLFEEIDRVKESLLRSGREVLDLGIGDPDLGAPVPLIESLKRTLDNSLNHRYPPGTGHPSLKSSLIRRLEKQYGVKLSEEEILITIGSKEAIGHFPLAVVDPGDLVLIPDPGYPVYYSSAIFAGADVHRMPLIESNDYWPRLGDIGDRDSEKARLMYLNYPNNPTSSTAPGERFEEALEFCRRHDIILANDAAYSDIYYEQPPAVLFPLARDAGIPYIEFFSFSKTLSITGWRVGFAIGSPGEISALATLKANIDSGVFTALQESISDVLDNSFGKITADIRDIYRGRRKMLSEGLDRAGFDYAVPGATFYFWVRVPGNKGSIQFCSELMESSGIIATPGVGFGRWGEGYFRLSLTAPDNTVKKAAEKLVALR